MRVRLNRNPLEQVRGYIPIDDTSCMNAVAQVRNNGEGVTLNTILREAVAEWKETHKQEIREAFGQINPNFEIAERIIA